MLDAGGAILAAEVFGWVGPGPRWWENSRIALTSPLVIACRYESEPFWCNMHGIHVRQRNLHIESLDLADFCNRMDRAGGCLAGLHQHCTRLGKRFQRILDLLRMRGTAPFDAYFVTLDSERGQQLAPSLAEFAAVDVDRMFSRLQQVDY